MATATAQPAETGEAQTSNRTTESGGRTEPTPEATTETSTELPKDVVFGLLSAERRRRLLTYLDDNDGETTLGDVAEHIAAGENGVEVDQLLSDQRKRVYVGLYQCHLPKMDDANVIEYDRDRGTIELREEADQLFPHLYLDTTGGWTSLSPGAFVRSTRLWAFLSERLP